MIEVSLVQRCERAALVMVLALMPLSSAATAVAQDPLPFGAKFPQLDANAVGNWSESDVRPSLLVPRDEVVAFALYTHDAGVLKMTAQLYPLLPDEPQTARLEFLLDGQWTPVAESRVVYPGWSAHFRVDPWDSSKTVAYRVRHGAEARFEGVIRRDPVDKPEIVVASLSCNSSRTPGSRATIVDNLARINPDLLFFAGDQTYKHTRHTEGWLEWGAQFRDIIRDRPVVAIPDDHDVGQSNLWGESGRQAATAQGPDGGYFWPADYVNMVQRCQTWHLPDPVDAAAVDRDIAVYFTRLRVGAVDFAIIEDRKFKSGPEGKIPQAGPRPDHITDTGYDPAALDVPGLELPGARQLKFLDAWSADWSGAEMKCVLSQTAFCGAVHLHGSRDERLMADLDCNGWPQTGRNEALRAIRRAWAPHLCGDQHLAVIVKHGIDAPRDAAWSFTSPAIVNTVYGRWWHPLDEQPGARPRDDSPLPWTGDYRDGLGNHIFMAAYANPDDVTDEKQRADGFGVARFDKRTRSITFQCWPRFSRVDAGDAAQFPGWPLTVAWQENDGRAIAGYLPELVAEDAECRPVIQVVDESSGEVLYTVRAPRSRWSPPVYAPGRYTIRAGLDRPDRVELTGQTATDTPQDSPVILRF